MTDSPADIEFFWDPVCPFAWITSRWIEKVKAQTDYSVDYRFISLRLINAHKNYATEFPKGYEHGHTAGLRMLRVAAAVRAELGREPISALYSAYGESYFDQPKSAGTAARDTLGTTDAIATCLNAVDLDPTYAGAADDSAWDSIIGEETDLALARTGRDVGTPIITFQPPDGLSFFGPVISRIPADEDALALWNAVTTLARFPGFAEMKRSLREVPQLAQLGGDGIDAPAMEDWQSGARAAHLPDTVEPDQR